ncbi:hypothetical protein BJY24_005270 [Nocardia transvalensis]|uniref:Uncharacterized protein n=1 Tax=Nocardia transvalensis TaxID=37333 RepID=A0A7W9PJ01_9NOCA|nr:hypothetical protein [Nocardia transvalensis]MBB5916358.1 hypothetical protein [Nocardia transvalensis]
MTEEDAAQEGTVVLHARLRSDFEDASSAAADGFVLQLTESLPDVCAAHGRPAAGKRAKDIRFARARRGWVQVTAANQLGTLISGMPRRVATGAPVQTELIKGVVEGEWPVCPRCLRVSSAYRWIGHAFIALGLVALYLVFAASQLGFRPTVLVLLIFPGWIPFGLLAAMLAYIRSTTIVRIMPIVDLTGVRLRAHANFVAALTTPRGRESRG